MTSRLEDYRTLLRSDLKAFAFKAFASLYPGGALIANWHIDAIIYQLERVRRGETTRLNINMPPRCLKSFLTSVVFPAFMLGQDPRLKIIVASYAHKLAADLANQFRELIESPWYKTLFSGTRISPRKNTEYETVTTARGFRLATSPDGSLTGRGGDIIIIDDPIKADDALSDVKRTAINSWFRNSLLTRLNDPDRGKIIVVCQRLHEDDLVGNLNLWNSGWTNLNLPAIAEEDESVLIGRDAYHLRKQDDLLHPERLSRAYLDRMKVEMGPDSFSAQYQQRPLPREGTIVKKSWLQYYDRLPPLDEGIVFQSWDTASKAGGTNDWSVCTTWLRHEGLFYLIDLFRERVDYPALKATAIRLARRHDPSRVYIEDTGVGTALVAELKREGVPSVAVDPERNKIDRLSVQSGKFEAGQVLFPRNAPYLGLLIRELCSFPQSKFDDQVDSVSYALKHGEVTYDLSGFDRNGPLWAELWRGFPDMRYIE